MYEHLDSCMTTIALLLTFHRGCVAIWNENQVPAAVTNFGAVTSFIGIGAYYRSLRWQRRDRGPPQEAHLNGEKRALIRKRVCKSICRSSYFERRGEKYVSAKRSHGKLFKDYSSIFFALFKQTWNYKFKYRNPYVLRKVRSDNVEEDEYVITCPVQARFGVIKAYYVTQQYNVNVLADEAKFPVLGRFIFSRDTGTLLAMAEEPAVEVETDSLFVSQEILYVWSRNYYNLTPTPSTDPVCGLEDAQKLRICTSLFAADEFRSQDLNFVPILQNVIVVCEKRRVHLAPRELQALHCLMRISLNNDCIYEEWVLGCKAQTKAGNPRTYYVSRHANLNHITVFRPVNSYFSGNQISVHRNFRNVGAAQAVSANVARTAIPSTSGDGHDPRLFTGGREDGTRTFSDWETVSMPWRSLELVNGSSSTSDGDEAGRSHADGEQSARESSSRNEKNENSSSFLNIFDA